MSLIRFSVFPNSEQNAVAVAVASRLCALTHTLPLTQLCVFVRPPQITIMMHRPMLEAKDVSLRLDKTGDHRLVLILESETDRDAWLDAINFEA